MEKPILLFDGVCNLCNFSVRFTIKRDPNFKFLFASLQSAVGQKLLKQFKLPTHEIYTFVLINKNKATMKSTATLEVFKRLKGLWPLLYTFIFIPNPIRDFIYDLIANNRYKWFGKRDQCMVPSSSIEKRFLDV